MEIERKFRVRGMPWRQASEAQTLSQGYLARDGQTVVRVRLSATSAWLTVKGPAQGIAREEFEYPIPRSDGEALLALCGDRVVEKTRYILWEEGARFEIDVFSGRNAGLVVAELELQDPEQDFPRPPWLGEEVSLDPRYRNSELCVHPYSEWSSESGEPSSAGPDSSS